MSGLSAFISKIFALLVSSDRELIQEEENIKSPSIV
jgi:hypothetical protein